MWHQYLCWKEANFVFLQENKYVRDSSFLSCILNYSKKWMLLSCPTGNQNECVLQACCHLSWPCELVFQSSEKVVLRHLKIGNESELEVFIVQLHSASSIFWGFCCSNKSRELKGEAALKRLMLTFNDLTLWSLKMMLFPPPSYSPSEFKDLKSLNFNRITFLHIWYLHWSGSP